MFKWNHLNIFCFIGPLHTTFGQMVTYGMVIFGYYQMIVLTIFSNTKGPSKERRQVWRGGLYGLRWCEGFGYTEMRSDSMLSVSIQTEHGHGARLILLDLN